MRIALLALSLTVVAVAPAAARHRVHRFSASIPPSADAVELAGIAPPTPDGTADQTYGDAAFARARDTRLATAGSYVCRKDARAPAYRDGYAVTPSHVSAPTVFDQDPRVQEPVMPAVTRFFWAVNSARIDDR